jgi:ATP-dependent Zn protease
MVMQLPERDKLSMSREQMTSRLAIMMVTRWGCCAILERGNQTIWKGVGIRRLAMMLGVWHARHRM